MVILGHLNITRYSIQNLYIVKCGSKGYQEKRHGTRYFNREFNIGSRLHQCHWTKKTLKREHELTQGQ